MYISYERKLDIVFKFDTFIRESGFCRTLQLTVNNSVFTVSNWHGDVLVLQYERKKVLVKKCAADVDVRLVAKVAELLMEGIGNE